MENFKILFGSLVIILATVLAYSCHKETDIKASQSDNDDISVEARGFGESCQTITNCLPFESIVFENVTLPSYPGCEFRVQLSYCKQFDPLLGTEIFAGNYKLLDIERCPALWDKWSTLVLDPASQEGEINDFINTVDLEVYTRLEDFLFAEFGNLVGCNKPLGTLVISFVKATCNTMCYYEYTTNPYPIGLDISSFNNDIVESRTIPKYGILVRTNCSSNACCQRRTQICYDPVENEISRTTNTYATYASNNPPICLGGVIDEPDLPSGAIITQCLPCDYRCD